MSPAESIEDNQVGQVDQVNEGQDEPIMLFLKINLPNSVLEYSVNPNALIQDIAQALMEDASHFYTSFNLVLNGLSLDLTTPLKCLEIKDGIDLVPDLYSEHLMRVHVNRLRNCMVPKQDAGFSFYSTLESEAAQAKLSEKMVDEKPVLEHDREWALKMLEKFNGPHDLNSLYALNKAPSNACLAKMGFSSWYPVPSDCRLRGDLVYLNVKTLEGQELEITGSSIGFSINGSTAETFSPEPVGQTFDTLPELLSSVSLLFKAGLEACQKAASLKNPLEHIGCILPAYPWAMAPRAHTPDAGRLFDSEFSAQEAMQTVYSRDWNDELQSAREMPTTEFSEKLAREQTMARFQSDFIDASVRTAKAVVYKALVPITLMDPDMSDVYIHNNLLVTCGVDSTEQVETYGSKAGAHVAVSKDIDGIKMVSQLDRDDIHTFGTSVVDFIGRRVVVQTIAPGVLTRLNTEEDTAVVYGCLDPKRIIKKDSFCALADSLGPALLCKPRTVIDGNGNQVTLSLPSEVKGLIGSDGRKYLLDLTRLFPVDIEFLDSVESDGFGAYPHQVTLLRRELIDSFNHLKYVEALKSFEKKLNEWKVSTKDLSAEEQEAAKPVFEFGMAFNSDVFTKTPLAGSDIESEKNLVREASQFIATLLNGAIKEFEAHPDTIPADTLALTQLLHNRGINMRYLGLLLSKVTDRQGAAWDTLKAVCIEEMVARACKVLLRELLHDTDTSLANRVISHFFNCLFSDKALASISGLGSFANRPELMKWSLMTPESLDQDIKQHVASRFRYNVTQKGSSIVLLRSICLKVGIQIQARNYFESLVEFTPKDILNLYPIVKTVLPRSHFGDQAMDHGRLSLAQGEPEVAIELFCQASSVFEQVVGLIHPDTGKCYDQVATCLFNAGKIQESIEYLKRSIIVHERIYGVDHLETLQRYANLGYFEIQAGKIEQGLVHILHSMTYTTFLSAQKVHPNVAASYSNLHSIVESFGLVETCIGMIEKAVEINESTFGHTHGATIATYDNLTHFQYVTGRFKSALLTAKKCYKAALVVYGETDSRTEQYSSLLPLLTSLAVQSAKKDLQIKNLSIKESKMVKESPKMAPEMAKTSESLADLPVDKILEFIGEPTRPKKASR